MKQKVITFCQHVFGVALMISVLIGAVVFLLLLVAFIIGGDAGQALAVFCKTVMFKAVTLAAIGSLVGMFVFYMEDSHMLTMRKDKQATEDYPEE